MKVYEAATREDKMMLGHAGQSNLITSLCLSYSGDHIYYITENNQLLRTELPLYDEPDPTIKVDFVHCGFHTEPVTGLDVCIRKQLIVTCSKDKTVRVWNYVTKQCEIVQNFPEECLAVAMHPSGFHLVVALNDKIQVMNILSKTINNNNCKNFQVK